MIERFKRIWEGLEPGFGPRERLEAGKILLDRGWGRAPEVSINVDATGTQAAEEAQTLADEQLRDLARELADPDAAREAARIDPSGGSLGGIEPLTPDTH